MRTVERPEQADAGRRIPIGAQPVEQQVRGIRDRTRRGNRPDVAARDPSCHKRSDNEDESDGGDAVSGTAVSDTWQQQVGIRENSEEGAPDDEWCEETCSPAKGNTPPGWVRTGAPNAPVICGGLGEPSHGKSGECVANWTRHRCFIIADSAYAAQRGESVSRQ